MAGYESEFVVIGERTVSISIVKIGTGNWYSVLRLSTSETEVQVKADRDLFDRYALVGD